MFLQMLNIEWGQIDPKDNRRVKPIVCFLYSTAGDYCYLYTL